MPSRQRVQDLIELVRRGKLPQAIEEFYADDVIMQENRQPPTVGKAANLERERSFAASVDRWHEARPVSVVIDGDQVAIDWVLEYSTADGTRVRMEEIAHQTWRDDRIVRERFFYDSATLAA
jgi:ketosteroid isomerase-like protein